MLERNYQATFIADCCHLSMITLWMPLTKGINCKVLWCLHFTHWKLYLCKVCLQEILPSKLYREFHQIKYPPHVVKRIYNFRNNHTFYSFIFQTHISTSGLWPIRSTFHLGEPGWQFILLTRPGMLNYLLVVWYMLETRSKDNSLR